MTDRMTPEQRHRCMSHIRSKGTDARGGAAAQRQPPVALQAPHPHPLQHRRGYPTPPTNEAVKDNALYQDKFGHPKIMYHGWEKDIVRKRNE